MSYVKASTANPLGWRPWQSRLQGFSGLGTVDFPNYATFVRSRWGVAREDRLAPIPRIYAPPEMAPSRAGGSVGRPAQFNFPPQGQQTRSSNDQGVATYRINPRTGQYQLYTTDVLPRGIFAENNFQPPAPPAVSALGTFIPLANTDKRRGLARKKDCPYRRARGLSGLGAQLFTGGPIRVPSIVAQPTIVAFPPAVQNPPGIVAPAPPPSSPVNVVPVQNPPFVRRVGGPQIFPLGPWPLNPPVTQTQPPAPIMMPPVPAPVISMPPSPSQSPAVTASGTPLQTPGPIVPALPPSSVVVDSSVPADTSSSSAADATSWFDQEMITGVPNKWLALGGVAFLLMHGGGKRK